MVVSGGSSGGAVVSGGTGGGATLSVGGGEPVVSGPGDNESTGGTLLSSGASGVSEGSGRSPPPHPAQGKTNTISNGQRRIARSGLRVSQRGEGTESAECNFSHWVPHVKALPEAGLELVPVCC